jgi:hypothetical protein
MDLKTEELDKNVKVSIEFITPAKPIRIVEGTKYCTKCGNLYKIFKLKRGRSTVSQVGSAGVCPECSTSTKYRKQHARMVKKSRSLKVQR